MTWLTDLRKPYSPAALLLALFLMTCVGLLYFGIGMFTTVWAQSPTGQDKASAAQAQADAKKAANNGKDADPAADLRAAAADLDSKTNNLKSLLESTEKRMTSIQSLVAVLATVGSILGIALGFSTYINLKELQSNTEKAAARLEKEAHTAIAGVGKELDQLRAEFPAVGHMNRAIEYILSDFRNTLLGFGGREAYEKMSPQERQEIELKELTFAALHLFEFRRVPTYRRKIAEIHRAFGSFYFWRYDAAPSEATALERSIVYLHRACDPDEPEVSAFANGDIGALYLRLSAAAQDPAQQPLLRAKSREYLMRAIPAAPTLPTLGNLAWIERREGRLADAIGFLDQAIERASKTSADEKEKQRHLGQIYLNRACYFAEQGKDEWSKQNYTARNRSYARAMEDVENARRTFEKYGRTEKWIKEMEGEAKAGGDLAQVVAFGPLA